MIARTFLLVSISWSALACAQDPNTDRYSTPEFVAAMMPSATCFETKVKNAGLFGDPRNGVSQGRSRAELEAKLKSYYESCGIDERVSQETAELLSNNPLLTELEANLFGQDIFVPFMGPYIMYGGKHSFEQMSAVSASVDCGRTELLKSEDFKSQDRVRISKAKQAAKLVCNPRSRQLAETQMKSAKKKSPDEIARILVHDITDKLIEVEARILLKTEGVEPPELERVPTPPPPPSPDLSK